MLHFKSNLLAGVLLAGVLLAGVLLAGCTKNEVVDYSAQTSASNYISFLPVSGLSSTKTVGPTTDTHYPVEWSFGTFAYNETSTAYINNAEVYCTDQTNAVSNGGTVWTTKQAYLWPKGSALTFYSYSPYSINQSVTCTYDNGITIKDFNVSSTQVDLMVADKITGQTSNGTNNVYYSGTDANNNSVNTTYTGVPTVFRHKLAYIAGFNLETDADYRAVHSSSYGNNIVKGAELQNNIANGSGTATYFEITGLYIDKIEFLNVYTVGTYSYSTDSNNSITYGGTLSNSRDNKGWVGSTVGNMTWTSTTNNDSYTADGTTKNAIPGPNSSTSDYLFVLPQDFAAVTNTKDAAQLKVSFHVTGTYYYVTATTKGTTTTYSVLTESKDIDPEGSYAIIDLSKGKDSNQANTTAWNENKKITYTITLGYTADGTSFNIIYWAPNVVDWEDEGWAINYQQ